MMISICALLEIENLLIIWLMLIFICFKLRGSVGKVEVILVIRVKAGK